MDTDETLHVKKVSFPCDSCRRRRRKCDRRTPVCSLCEKRNDECVYDPTLDQRRPAQKNYVAALEERVALLEGILRGPSTSDIDSYLGFSLIEGGDSTLQATRAESLALPPTVTAHPKPELELGLESELGFIPPDDAAQAFVPIAHPNPGEVAITSPKELDLGMSGYVPLVSLDMEHKLLAQFWDWQRMHLPFVAPIPLLAAYAVHSQTAHPGEPIPPPPPPAPDVFPGPSATFVPNAESVHVTPELAQFISPLLLDALFAIAALFYGNLETSNQFYKRAEVRMLEEAASPRLATVQGVMLMAIAELGHARAPAAWTFNSVAVALCIRLGMHIDATPLVRCGTMSKTLFETRNFVFWAAYNTDRFYAICMGLHPLMDRRLISTPGHSSLAATNVSVSVKPQLHTAAPKSPSSLAEMPDIYSVGITWWSPQTLGMGDVIIQAAWEAIRNLVRLTDMIFDEIYAFDAPKRTSQEGLELVARNHLIIQRFLDALPAWMRSTGAIRKKDTGIVYLHLFIHLVSILACRPFLSPRPLSEDAMRLDAVTDISQPAHSSHIIRRYRTLAFRVARASALQITSLIRYIPLSSPCVTLPYVVYSACTILLLAPDDVAAMNGVRTSLACLESMHGTGYWVSSARAAGERIYALARRWGVDIGQGKKVLGPADTGSGGGASRGDDAGSHSHSGAGAINAEESDNGGAQELLGSSSRTHPTHGTGASAGAGSAGVTRPPASIVTHDENAESGAMHDRGHSDRAQQYEDILGQMYVNQECLEDVTSTSNQEYTVPLSQDGNNTATSHGHYAALAQNYDPQEQSEDLYSHTSGLMYAESANRPSYTHQQQSYASTQPIPHESQSYSVFNNYSSQLYSGIIGHEPQVQHRERLVSELQQQIYQQPQYQQQPYQPLSEQQQQTQYQPHTHYQSQGSKPYPPTPHHIHIQQCYPQHYCEPTPSVSIPHVAYALSHADPQHDSQLPHIHWHQILPPVDPNLPFSPDPAACADLAACFADTVQMAQEPTFVRLIDDPYAGVAKDWLSDMANGFPAISMDMYAALGGAGTGTGTGAAASTLLNGGVSEMQMQDSETERSYTHRLPTYDYDGA
ncbi:hypothetical protein BDV93DRAFT_603272 [Ceratobasidium sp. AG-I]|nr:hypothetical protein BDV93DRAFT_603272 [Ceratobasidium sp. AG-I]